MFLAASLLVLGLGACGDGSATRNKATTSTEHVVAATVPRSKPIPTPEKVKLGYQSFGPLAGDVERRRVTTIVKRYYRAASTGNATEACSLLYAPIAKSVAQDYGSNSRRPDLHGTTCVTVLSRIFKHRDGRPTKNLAAIRVGGVRLNKYEEALALLHFPTGTLGEISLHREDGTWKVLQLLGNPLRGSR